MGSNSADSLVVSNHVQMPENKAFDSQTPVSQLHGWKRNKATGMQRDQMMQQQPLQLTGDAGETVSASK